MIIELDDNAGIKIEDDTIKVWESYNIGNVFGFGPQKRHVHEEVEEERKFLC